MVCFLRKSHLFKYSVETNHKTVTLDAFKIIGKVCKRLKFRLELAKSLHIKEKPSDLNTEVASVCSELQVKCFFGIIAVNIF